MTPPAIAPARLLDEEAEKLEEADAVLVGPMTAELVRGNSIALPPEHDVALTAEMLNVPVDTPNVVRVPFVISENIFTVKPVPVGKDRLSSEQDGVKAITLSVILMPCANIPCAVSK